MSGVLSDVEEERVVLEIIGAAGPGGMDEDEIVKGFTALSDLAVSAALFAAWQNSLFRVSWDVDTQELKWRVKDD